MASVEGGSAGDEALVLGEPVDAPEPVWTRVMSRALDPAAEPVAAELVPGDLAPDDVASGHDDLPHDGPAHDSSHGVESHWATDEPGPGHHVDDSGGMGSTPDDSWNG